MAGNTAGTEDVCARTRGNVRRGRSQRYVSKGGRSIDFLGFVFNGASVRVRKNIKKRFAVRYARAVKNENASRQTALRASFKGWCKWGDGKHLYKTLTNENMSFSKLGIKSRPNTDQQGKRIFNAKFYPLSNIVGEQITILDFEDGIDIPKKNGDQNQSDKPRCAVLFKFQTGTNAGNTGKFITSSHELRDVLIQAREQETRSGSAIFPCEDCKIGTQRTGRYTNYYFED